VTLAGLFRRWCLRQCLADERAGAAITPLNAEAEWLSASPDTLAFHWLLKRPLRAAARAITVPRAWIDRLDGNAKVLHEIVTETYLAHEKQARRRSLLQPVIEYALCLAAFDNNYTEVFDAVLAGIVRNRDRFAFDVHQINPDNWFQDGRGRYEIQQAPEPFTVLSQTATDLVVSAPLGGGVVTTIPDATGIPTYLAVDLGGVTTPYPGIYVYPIRAQGHAVLDVAAGVFAKEATA